MPVVVEGNPQVQFPKHAKPRIWLVTSFTCPTGQCATKLALAHGDSVVAGILPGESARRHEAPDRTQALQDFWQQAEKEGWKDRIKIVKLDGSSIGLCQAAVADAIATFGRIDILLHCSTETIVGSIEELGISLAGQTLIRDQFETNFYGPVNVMRAVIPSMRSRGGGHLVLITSVTGQMGTPGLGAYCAANWALEGLCDSMAYEVAPFNVKMTVIQNNLEVNLLTNKITSIAPLAPYAREKNQAPLARNIIADLLDRIAAETKSEAIGKALEPTALRSPGQFSASFPSLPFEMRMKMVAETIHAVIAIAGHDNPPLRHIVSVEGVASVKEKLKTFSEELEDLVEVSYSADIEDEDGKAIKIEDAETE